MNYNHKNGSGRPQSSPHLSANIDRGGLLLSSAESEVISLSNMPDELGLEDKRQHSISFSGMSVIIESMIKSNSRATLRINRPEIEAAILSDDLPYLIDKFENENDRDGLQMAIILSVETNKPNLLSKLIEFYKDDISSIKTLNEKDLLHVGALGGHKEICELLMYKGKCDPNAVNTNDGLSPLHAAVSGGHLDILKMFHKDGNGDIHLGSEMSSLMYTAVRSNQPDIVQYLLDYKSNRMGMHKFTETALHLCAEHNYCLIASLLLASGTVFIDALRGENMRETALHIAAKNGYLKMVDMLLKAGADPNAPNSKKETPLHLAGKVLSRSIIRLLIRKEACMDARDIDGRPPLHCIINSEHQGATDCIRVLIENNVNLNSSDNNGVTALHLAALNRKASQVNLLIAHGADLCSKNKNGKPALYFALKYTPGCVNAIQERMDAAIHMENPESDINCKIKMDFKTLIPCSNSLQGEVSLFTELLNIQGGDNHRNLAKILLHPLAEAFLHIKWNQIKWLYYIFILFSHFIYSVTYSLYAILVYKSLCSPKDNWKEGIFLSHECSFDNSNPRVQLAITSWIFLVIFNILYILKETTKCIHLGYRYLREYESLLNVFIIIIFLLISFHSDPFSETIVLSAWQYHAAGFGVFSTWLFLMFLIGKVPRFGKYVEMFKTVSKTFLDFLIAYVFLFVAFVLTFYLLIPSHVAFNGSLPAAFVKVLVMMLGEIEYDDLYYPEKHRIKMAGLTTNQSGWEGLIESEVEAQIFPFTAHIFVTIFIVLVSIIIMNLLFGLAVTDIQELYKTAKLHQRIQQVQLISYMESVILSPLFQYFPDSLKMFLRKVLQGVTGNYKYVKVIEPNNFQDKLLPASLKKRLWKEQQEKYGKSQQSMMEDTQLCLGSIKMQLDELKEMVLSLKANPNGIQSSSISANLIEDEPDRKNSFLRVLPHKRYSSSNSCLEKLENLRGRRPSNSSTKMLVEEEDFDSDICESPQAHTEYCGHDSFMLSFSAQNTHKSPQSLGKINEAATISSSSVSSIKDNNSDSK
ncbi:uncharacterized protein [Lepeophtheirus salmonis]|uniref:uncharacterized protein n=1 Tax=Lepeophtheirus salmonis TaxID=72036 RepID=UPI001AE29B18|nr:transient receptor potential channel pyrexia-like [Lepeophtheirus salmonis]